MALTLVPPHGERGTGPFGQSELGETDNGAPERVDRVGRAPVNPGVAARPARAEPEATRAQAVRDDPTEAGPVQREKGRSVPGGSPLAKEVADAAQIALSLLAHGCREEEGAASAGRVSTITLASANSAASPRPSSEMPGPTSLRPSSRTRTSVPCGKMVSR